MKKVILKDMSEMVFYCYALSFEEVLSEQETIVSGRYIELFPTPEQIGTRIRYLRDFVASQPRCQLD